MATYTLTVNAKQHTVEAQPETPLLWILRDTIGLTGTKFSCGKGLCGCCTVIINGKATKSCVATIERVHNQKITTIEGLSAGGSHPIRLRERYLAWEGAARSSPGFASRAPRAA